MRKGVARRVSKLFEITEPCKTAGIEIQVCITSKPVLVPLSYTLGNVI